MEVYTKNIKTYFLICLCMIQSLSKKVNILTDYESIDENIKHYYLNVDSKSNNVVNYFLKDILEVELKNFGYLDKFLFEYHFVFNELYANAVIHGNKAGSVEDYELRNVPIPINLEKNKNKPIKIDSLITPKFCLLNFKDSGEGFDYFKQKEPPSPLVLHGRGLFMIDQFSDFVQYSKEGSEILVCKVKK